VQDTKLFETILGITALWHIARVALKPADQRVDLWRTRWRLSLTNVCVLRWRSRKWGCSSNV
jgi:hypothetical protein